jgi:hypothetical protein
MNCLNIINIKTTIIIIIAIVKVIIYLPVTIVSTAVCPWYELLEASLRRIFLAGGMMGGS